MENKLIHRFFVALFALFLTACMESENDAANSRVEGGGADHSSQAAQQPLPIQPPAVQTDFTSVNGLELELLDNNGACQINDGTQTRYLKPMSPCHFMRVSGSLQLYQKGKATVIAVVGTPVKPRCGQEVQGIVISNGELEISQELGQGSIFCADKGLDGFHFSLF